MRHLPGPFAAALVGLFASATAGADISYSFNAALTPQGRIDGALTVSEAAIADGSITINEITANFVLSDVSPPFAPTTFTTSELGEILSLNFGEFYVDRSSGASLTEAFVITAIDAETGQSLNIGAGGLSVHTGTGANTIGIQTPWTVSGGGPGAVSGGPGGPGENITYTFATSGAATPAPGRLNGSFSVPKTAIADGIITFADIISADFSITDPTPPYVPITLDRNSFGQRFHGPDNSQEVRVNPITGAFLHDFLLSSGGVNLFPHRYLVFSPPYVSVAPQGRGQLTVTVSGGGSTGVATPVQVPALQPLALASMLALLGLAGTLLLRRRQN